MLLHYVMDGKENSTSRVKKDQHEGPDGAVGGRRGSEFNHQVVH